MLPGTGHRICNDCMKACIFQKQEPVNIPQIETGGAHRRARAALGLRDLRPAHALEPAQREAAARAALQRQERARRRASGPAGYTLAHHLAREGFGVRRRRRAQDRAAARSSSPATSTHAAAPDQATSTSMYLELDERVLLGFGGVSEYGITVRWDKNFLTVLYVTLARQRLLAHVRRRPLRRHARPRRRVAARLRPRRDRRGRGAADDHPAQEQPRRAASARRATS